VSSKKSLAVLEIGLEGAHNITVTQRILVTVFLTADPINFILPKIFIRGVELFNGGS
jgi:hypothetical protein